MKVVNQVNQTTDYSKFKTLKGNRSVNKLHVKRLQKSFKQSYLLSPIIVNQNYEIIDGQHRFNAAKAENLPVNFILCNDYGLNEDILLLGYREDIPDLLTLMDILVFPSHRREGIPRVIMESSTIGLPIIATRVGGVPEMIIDGVTGILVDPHSSNVLVESILSLLENPEQAKEMGENARIHALEHFDERQFFWKTDLEYRRLINEKLGVDVDSYLKPLPNS